MATATAGAAAAAIALSKYLRVGAGARVEVGDAGSRRGDGSTEAFLELSELWCGNEVCRPVFLFILYLFLLIFKLSCHYYYIGTISISLSMVFFSSIA